MARVAETPRRIKMAYCERKLEKVGLTAKRYGIVRLYPSRTAVALSLP